MDGQALADRRFYSTRRAREAVRDAERARPRVEERSEYVAWQEPDAGHPLGHGMPTGEPLREDGESHLEAWKDMLRGDPCAFCGTRMLPCPWTPTGASVDHIIPGGSRRRYVQRWSNLTGACQSCNRSKASKPLLLWMRQRSRQHNGGQNAAALPLSAAA